MAEQPLIIAHRGFSAQFPENTVAAVRGAIQCGADMVEIDVQETADGKIAVFHDQRLRRLCGIPGRISDVPWRQVRKAKPDVPSLAQVLAVVRDRIPLLIEIKSADPVKVARILEKEQMVSQVIVFAFDIPVMEQLAGTNHEIRRFGLIAEDPTQSVRALTDAVDVEGIGVGNRLLNSSADVRGLKRKVGKVFVWTVNLASRMRQLAAWGVDGIITNRPDLAKKTLTEVHAY